MRETHLPSEALKQDPSSSSCRVGRTASLEGMQVSLGVQLVLPLLVEDGQQAFTHRVAAGLRPAGASTGSVWPSSDSTVRPSMIGRTVAIRSRGPRDVRHLLPGQVQGIPWRRVTEDRRLIQESVANTRCRSVSMNDHSPSTDSCNSSGRRRRARSTVSSQSRPRMSHASRNPAGSPGGSWPNPDTAGPARPRPGPDVDAIDRQVLDLTVDVDVDQLDAAHHHPAQLGTTEPGVSQVDGPELRAAEVNRLEPGAMEIGRSEVSHPTTLSLPADNPPRRPLVRAGEVVYARRSHRLRRGSTGRRGGRGGTHGTWRSLVSAPALGLSRN